MVAGCTNRARISVRLSISSNCLQVLRQAHGIRINNIGRIRFVPVHKLDSTNSQSFISSSPVLGEAKTSASLFRRTKIFHKFSWKILFYSYHKFPALTIYWTEQCNRSSFVSFTAELSAILILLYNQSNINLWIYRLFRVFLCLYMRVYSNVQPVSWVISVRKIVLPESDRMRKWGCVCVFVTDKCIGKNEYEHATPRLPFSSSSSLTRPLFPLAVAIKQSFIVSCLLFEPASMELFSTKMLHRRQQKAKLLILSHCMQCFCSRRTRLHDYIECKCAAWKY